MNSFTKESSFHYGELSWHMLYLFLCLYYGAYISYFFPGKCGEFLRVKVKVWVYK